MTDQSHQKDFDEVVMHAEFVPIVAATYLAQIMVHIRKILDTGQDVDAVVFGVKFHSGRISATAAGTREDETLIVEDFRRRLEQGKR